jgi:hypothetical protein
MANILAFGFSFVFGAPCHIRYSGPLHYRTFDSLAQRLRAPRIKARNHKRQRGRESNRSNQAANTSLIKSVFKRFCHLRTRKKNHQTQWHFCNFHLKCHGVAPKRANF